LLCRALALALALPTVALVTGPPTGAVAAGAATCHGRPATIVGTAGDDRLVGTDGPDVIVGLGGNDRVWGAQGNDRLCGGLGADDLLGGSGDDRLYGGPGGRQHRQREGITLVTGDRLDGGPGDDLLAAHVDYGRHAALRRPDTVTYRDSDGPVQVDLGAGTADGDGHDTIAGIDGLRVLGSAYDDVLTGSARHDYLDGGAGDDRLSGRGRADALIAGGGDDTVTGGSGGDMEFSDRGADTLSGQAGRDLLGVFSAAGSTVHGGRGPDVVVSTLTSQSGDVLDGGPGRNGLELLSLLSPDQHAAIGVDRTSGTAVAQAGTTTTKVAFSGFGAFGLLGAGAWSFQGTDEADEVQVIEGSLHASTAGGDDFLDGDKRDDTLDGGLGTDTAFGGGGTNTCLDTEKGNCDGYPGMRPARSLSTWLGEAQALRGVPGVHRMLEAVRRAPLR